MSECSIIVPIAGRLDCAKRCIEHIRKYTPPIYELIIVASNVRKDEYNQISELGDVVLQSKSIIPFPKAINLGIQLSKGGYIGIVTSDVYVRPHWLEPLYLALSRNKQLGWVSSQIIQPDGLFRPFNISCSLIHTEAIGKVGLMDEQYGEGKGFEDIDWFFRFVMNGYKPIGIVNSIADHPESEVSFKAIYGKKIKEMDRKCQEIFFRKWHFLPINISYVSVEYFFDRYDWLRLNASGKIVDLGSAGGHTFGDRATNVDIDLYDCPNFVRADISNLPFKDKEYDTACIGDTLEHVENPVQVLKEAARVAKKILITVPNEYKMGKETVKDMHPYESEKAHKKAVERWIRDNKPLEVVDDKKKPHLFHIRKYTEKKLKKDLDNAGLDYTLSELHYKVGNEDLYFFTVKAWRKNK